MRPESGLRGRPLSWGDWKTHPRRWRGCPSLCRADSRRAPKTAMSGRSRFLLAASSHSPPLLQAGSPPPVKTHLHSGVSLLSLVSPRKSCPTPRSAQVPLPGDAQLRAPPWGLAALKLCGLEASLLSSRQRPNAPCINPTAPSELTGACLMGRSGRGRWVTGLASGPEAQTGSFNSKTAFSGLQNFFRTYLYY